MAFFGDGRCPVPPHAVASAPLFSETESEVAFVAACVCAALGIVGNVLTFVVLLFNPPIRNHPTSPFLFSLAFSDLIMSAFSLPVMAIRFKNRELTHGYEVCRCFAFFYYSNILVSILSMALIAVNRFVGIYYPHVAPRIFTLRKSWLMVGLSWVAALGLMSLPLLELWGQLGYQRLTFSCTVLPKNGHDPTVFLIVTGALLPFAVMVACYGLIYWHVRKTGQRMRKVMSRNGEGESEPALAGRHRSVHRMTRRREKDLTRTLLLICLSFLVCFLPSALIAIIDPMPPCWEHSGWHIATYIVFWCSAFVNPVIYVVCNRYYRVALVATLAKAAPCLTSPPSPPTWFDDDDDSASTPRETVFTDSTRTTRTTRSASTNTTVSARSRKSRASNVKSRRYKTNRVKGPVPREEEEEGRRDGTRHESHRREEAPGRGAPSSLHEEERRLMVERRREPKAVSQNSGEKRRRRSDGEGDAFETRDNLRTQRRRSRSASVR